MEKSTLQIARAAYQPKLPKALQGAVKVKEGAPTQSVGGVLVIRKKSRSSSPTPMVCLSFSLNQLLRLTPRK